MKLIVNSKQMKEIDQHTIENIGIPGIVLMERAALAVTQAVINISGLNDRILIICGIGNNGADGVAVARLLKLQGYKVEIFVAGDITKATPLFLQQIDIAKNLSISIYNKLELDEYTILVDAIFGVGLNRILDEYYSNLIERINATGKKVVSVDIPSGLSSDTGKAMGAVVNAFVTVTFGFLKMGLILYPGCEIAGRVEIADIGFPEIALQNVGFSGYIYENEDLCQLPIRKSNSNKGTFGKVLVIAGSKDIYGACYFSAKAAYRTGAGLVKVVTHSQNKTALTTSLPEALLYTYDAELLEAQLLGDLRSMIEWASVIVMGPGMGFTNTSKAIFKFVLQNTTKPLILDADAIQLLSKFADEEIGKEFCKDYLENVNLGDKNLLGDGYVDKKHLSGIDNVPVDNISMIDRIKYFNKVLPAQTILTPHMKELSDLLKMPLQEIKDSILSIADTCTEANNIIYILKDARTIVAQGKNRYINISGNSGMATGGSGDVLTGIIAGLIAQGLPYAKASELGVYIHGLSGDTGKDKYGAYALLASDIIDMLAIVMKEKK